MGGVDDQFPKASLAAATAASTPSAPTSGTRAITFPVAGSKTSKSFPFDQKDPPISGRSSLIVIFSLLFNRLEPVVAWSPLVLSLLRAVRWISAKPWFVVLGGLVGSRHSGAPDNWSSSRY
ncbi:hypothetical protein RHECNPAF_13300168 [Rhizobium etli CNPAF512]|nr:hypothetical protein RHECNPAF_13300168 [Rhizobium etli CNPAF512]